MAIAYYARVYGLKAYIFVPAHYTPGRAGEMLDYGAEIIPVNGSYERAVLESRKFAAENGVYDANPGSKPEVDYLGYSTIAEDILREVKPDAVLVPVGNGTTLAGIYRGFAENGVRPRMIGVTTSLGNQVLRVFYGSERDEFVETESNEPLVSLISFDLNEALKAIKESNGYVFGFADDTALYYADMLALEGLSVFLASALTLAGLVKFVRKFGIWNGNFILILTGGARGGEGANLNGGTLSYVRWENRARARAVFEKV